MNRTIFSNGLWNVLGGMSSAIVAVLVPPFLTRALPPEAYGAWAVALQIGTYVNIFGLGIQTAVGRYVAFHHDVNATRDRDAIVASAFWSVLAIAVLGAVAVGGFALSSNRLFPQLSDTWATDAAVAAAILGVSFGIGLIGSVFGSVFLGLQKSHVPAMVQLAGRVTQAGLLIAAAQTGSLTAMALAHLVGSIGISALLARLWVRGTRAPTIAPRLVTRASLRELGGFCASLTVWNLAMLLVSGLDLIIITRFQPDAVPYYAVSLTLVSFIAGTIQALAGALTPAAAAMQAARSQRELHDLFVRATGLVSVAALLVSAPLVFAGQGILTLWVGAAYAAQAHQILTLLAVATVIRTCLLPYGMIAIGTGQQHRMMYTPLIEGVVSLGLSIWWAGRYGVLGVAGAKVVSAAIGIALLIGQHALVHTMPDLSRRAVLRAGIARPALFWLLLAALVMGVLHLGLPALLRYPALLFVLFAVTLLMAWSELHAALRQFLKRRQVHA